MEKSKIEKETENRAIDKSQIELGEISSQLQSFAVLLKGYTFQETQNEDLAGLGIAIEKLAIDIQSISDLLSSAFNPIK